METRYVRLDDAAAEGMVDGDLLLYRAGWSLPDFVISRAGRTWYTHAARAYRGFKCWRSIETRAWRGGQNLSLAREVRLYAHRIDVFQPNAGGIAEANGCHYSAKRAVVWLQQHLVDRKYGWWSIWRASCLHLPIVRLCVRPQTDDEAENGGLLPYCSHAQAMADRYAGFDPVPNLPDRLTEPGDLARSPFYRYRFTLEP
jgi:hypothetical protein